MWTFLAVSVLQTASTELSCPFLPPNLCHIPSWSDSPFDHPMILTEQYKSWRSSLCCFIHPALIFYLSVPDIFLSAQILNTHGLVFISCCDWPSFTPTWQRTKLWFCVWHFDIDQSDSTVCSTWPSLWTCCVNMLLEACLLRYANCS
jgi:hypothetical protein